MNRTLLAAILLLGSAANQPRQGSHAMKTEIDGTWELVRHTVRGRDDDNAIALNARITRSNSIQIFMQDGKPPVKFRFQVDSDSKPRRIKFLALDEDRILNKGIYELVGNEMKLSIYADRHKQKTDWPCDFDATDDKTITILRRIEDQQ